MLTKDLLKYTRRSGKVQPSFLKEDDEALLASAKAMIDLLSSGDGRTRGDLEEELDDLVRGANSQFIARGFKKLLLDRCDFSCPGEADWAERRRTALNRSALFLRRCSFESPERLRDVVLGGNDLPLYADLPDFERLAKFRPLYPKQLVQRYNTAQVQGLLFDTASLTVATADTKAANLRRTFKFLKFFRLLSKVVRQEDGTLTMTVDGPLNILDSARKYGLQLASFFPAVCLLDDWTFEAEVKAKQRPYKLKLDHTSGYVSHYRHLSAYVPEEVRMFAQMFKEKVNGWTINPNSPFLNMGDAEIVFPDFTFKDASGNQVYLELFHRWHRGNLLPRLRYCIAKGDGPLILGIDRSLMTTELQELLDTGVFPEHRYFLFRDYPTVTKVTKCLKGY